MALIARDKLGRGQYVEVSLFDIAMAMTLFYGTAYLISGDNPGRFGNSPNGSPTVGVYQASDGPLYMACANDRLYRRLFDEVFQRPDVTSDPKFATARRAPPTRPSCARSPTDLCQRYAGKLDRQAEEGQHSGRLPAHGAAGF